MGITLNDLEALQRKGVLLSSTRSLLDVGSSNLYQASKDGILRFLEAYGVGNSRETDAFAERLSTGSIYDTTSGGMNEAFVGELIEQAGIRYDAIDIADGYRTTILDLNHQPAPPHFVGEFDLVLNYGTTEHLLNQYNAFKVLHDSTRKGGHIVHSLPCVGYSNHGYITYTPRCLFDLAGYNQYEVVDFWFSGPGEENDLFKPLGDYSSYFPALTGAVDAMKAQEIGNYLTGMQLRDISLQVIFRKVRDRPFAGALETTTSVGTVSDMVKGLYVGAARIDNAQLAKQGKNLHDTFTLLFKKIFPLRLTKL